MPFLHAAGRPLTELNLRYRGGLRFAVGQPFRWVDPRDADFRFRRALVESGVTVLRARTMWTASAALALPRWRDPGLLPCCAYLGALYLQVVAAAALSSGVEHLVALFVRLAQGRPGPTPHRGPTLRVPGGRA